MNDPGGLSPAQAQQRLAQDDPNALPMSPQRSMLRLAGVKWARAHRDKGAKG
jgi:hypothetical protein